MPYYRARYYDPQIGRFISEDPIRFWGGIDFYKYADNNPVNETDPDGLLPGPSCFYYLYKCQKTAKQCRASLDQASGNDELNLCQGTHSNNPDEAYFKSCFQENYYCQKAVQSCGQDAVTPPFNQTNIGNGPPNNIGPKPDPPTPTHFPPNYPGKPLPNLY